jgi:serine protease AprX
MQPAARPALPLPVRLRASTAATGKGVGIAMVDSDFVAHPDLCQPTQRIRCYYNAVDAREEALPTQLPLARHWHGTMTACTAAGNGFMSGGQYTSLAPEAHIVAIRTMASEQERNKISTATIVRALEWIAKNALEHGIRIVNLSVYADEVDHTLQHPVNHLVEQLTKDGIVVVAAAGNNPFAPIRPPAAAPSAITVGGLNDNNSFDQAEAELYHSTFGVTTLGIQKPDVVAPSIWLPAPILAGTETANEAAALVALDACTEEMFALVAPLLLPFTKVKPAESDAETRAAIETRIERELITTPHYKMVDGTSFAAPIVCSIIAQMLTVAPHLTPAHVKSILTATAIRVPNQPAMRQGYGVVQQRAAIRLCEQSRPPSSTTLTSSVA